MLEKLLRIAFHKRGVVSSFVLFDAFPIPCPVGLADSARHVGSQRGKDPMERYGKDGKKVFERNRLNYKAQVGILKI